AACRTALGGLSAHCRTVSLCARRAVSLGTVTLRACRTAASCRFLSLIFGKISCLFACGILRTYNGNNVFLFRAFRFRLFSCPLLYFSVFCLFLLHWLSLLF